MTPASPAPAPTPDTCLVTGATGAIGPALVRALVADGRRVRVLARTLPPPGVLPDGIDIARGDITAKGDLRETMQGVSRVFHLAARLHVPNPAPDLFPEFERVNVSGTRAVATAAREAGVDRMVYMSTIAVYGPSQGHRLSEATAPAPDTIYASTKLAGEEAARSVAAQGGMTTTVLRLAAVYGPRVKGNYRRLLDALARGRFVPIGPGLNRRTLVHDVDVARAAVLAAWHPAAANDTFNVTDGSTPTLAEVIDAMCRALGRRPPGWSLPVGPTRLTASVAERTARIAGRRLPLSASVDKYLEDVAVDGSRLGDRLGFAAAHDLNTGWRQTVDALREAGEL